MFKKLFGSGERPARDAPTAAALSEEEIQARIDSVPHWYHKIEVAPGVFTPGVHESTDAFNQLDVSQDLSDKRLLDVGSRDGFFSFEAERRGAEVLAVDAVALEHLRGFQAARELLGSQVKFETANVYNITSERFGYFDLVFFLGVLYHLRDPMLALDKLHSVMNLGATLWVESHTIDGGFSDPETGKWANISEIAPEIADVPLVQFYPGASLGGNPSNWWGPNQAALEAMCASAGFGIVRSESFGNRGLVVCRKVVDQDSGFWRDFDRAEGTGEEGMAWEGDWMNPESGGFKP